MPHNGLMPKTNRWHPVMLPDDYLRRLKHDLAEAAAAAGSATHMEPDLNSPLSPTIRPPVASRRDLYGRTRCLIYISTRN